MQKTFSSLTLPPDWISRVFDPPPARISRIPSIGERGADFFWNNHYLSIEANFQRKVTIIHDAYCFQLRKFSNTNSHGTKINFDFARENLLCLVSDFNHSSEISLFICSARTLPRIFWTIICSVQICCDGSFLMWLQCVSFMTNSCPLI